MLGEKIRELRRAGLEFEQIVEKVLDYQNHTHILFALESLTNLARNGRTSPAVAKIAGVLGIRVVGYAKNGQLAPVHKPRGEKKTLQTLMDMMVERGLYDGALVRIAHCFGREVAEKLKALVLGRYPNCRIIIEQTTALCSFYAEVGGLIVGFEGSYNEENNNQAC
jgi:DegV family protein with EDD domain